MTLTNEPTPKKKLKKWHIAVLVFVVLPLILMVIGIVSPTPSNKPEAKPTATASAKPKVTPTKEPVKVAQFSAELTRWEPLNPVSGRAVFTIRNISDVAGAPGTCTVKVEDLSHTYVGYDWITLDNTIQPGAKFMGNVILKVTKEGAAFVTQGSVTCS